MGKTQGTKNPRIKTERLKRIQILSRIRNEKGNLRYDYFLSLEDEETILLIDSWENQEALDIHHASPMMKELAALREKYDLHMRAERFSSIDDNGDDSFIRK